MKSNLGSKFSLIFSMVTFGTIGIFVNYTPLPSGSIAFVRGIIGGLCLVAYALLSKTKISFKNIKDNLLILLLSGAAIGFNWIFLFEAYKNAGVPIATVCYYMAPVFIILASPIVLKERLTAKKLICVAVALLGMVFVSGVFKFGKISLITLLGIAFGLLAAALYASVILLNKKLGEISAHNRTFVQLLVAGLVVLPYSLCFEKVSLENLNSTAIIMLLVLGFVHTGGAYLLYFGSLKNLSAQTAAIFSYIDPIVALMLSPIILKQFMNGLEIIGTILILAAALISELPQKQK